MRRKWLVSSLAASGLFLAVIVWHTSGQGPGKQGGKADVALPIRQVVLFNSGVGYFQREGQVTGDTQVDLSFPVGDVNDLLKSLTLNDSGGGHVGTVNYDSHDPVDKVLHSFAIDLNNNPTFSQILNQARGEKIEVTLKSDKKSAEPVKQIGTIIGMEVQKRPGGKDQLMDVDFLNLTGETGITSVPMDQVQTVRFINPVLDAELQRALRVVASSHDMQKKAVSLNFMGNGKRNVKVGYVVEHPIWKTSYRLQIEPNGKLFIQGWGIVENTSDEDWKDVNLSLVSGRPISFRMDLYNPLYIPRPLVEPELFASLRPPVYDSALESLGRKKFDDAPAKQGPPKDSKPGEAKKKAEKEVYRDQEKAMDKLEEMQKALEPLDLKQGVASVASASAIGEYYQYVIDHKISLPRQKSAMLPILNQNIEGNKVSIYNPATQPKFPLLGIRLKNSAEMPLNQGPITVYEENSYSGDTRILDLNAGEERLLSYALDQAMEVKTDVKSTPSPDMHFQIGEGNLTAHYKMRETRTYTIKNRAKKERTLVLEHAIRGGWSLVEPKKATETTRDLYRFEFKVPADKTVTFDVVEDLARTDNVNLSNGQPQYVAGSGINVKLQQHTYPTKLLNVKIHKGFIMPTLKFRDSKTYFIQNGSDVAREFTVDHIVPAGWVRLIDDGGEAQRGPDTFRFALKVAPNKTGTKEFVEERTYEEKGKLVKDLGEEQTRAYLANPVPNADVKAALTKVLKMNAQIVETAGKLAEQEKQHKQLSDDQGRLRENLKVIPASSEPYKKFLEKFVNQETDIEAFQKEIRQLQASLQRQQRELDVFIAGLTVE